jgi:hypothetical protein
LIQGISRLVGEKPIERKGDVGERDGAQGKEPHLPFGNFASGRHLALVPDS